MPMFKKKSEEEKHEKLFTIDEMAALLDVEKRQLVEWVQYRRIPYVKVNNTQVRFRVSDIAEWVKESHKKLNRPKVSLR